MQTKICSMCKQELPLSVFPEKAKKSNAYVTQYEGRCRPCKAQYARDWRKRNPGYRGSGLLVSVPEEDRLLVSAISARLTDARSRAKKYKQPAVEVDREYLYQLWKAQQGLCALSGVPLRIEKHAIANLSLDKIKPELGYVRGNVQWVAWAVNRAKGDMSEEVFLDMCQKILEYQKVQRLSKDAA